MGGREEGRTEGCERGMGKERKLRRAVKTRNDVMDESVYFLSFSLRVCWQSISFGVTINLSFLSCKILQNQNLKSTSWRAEGYVAVLPSNFRVSGIAPRSIRGTGIRVTTHVGVILTINIFRNPQMTVRALRNPSLTRKARTGDIHIATISNAAAIVTIYELFHKLIRSIEGNPDSPASGIREIFACGILNPGLCSPEYFSRNLNPIYDWNPVSKFH